MPTASRLALPHITLLAALCGGASAQTAGGTASLRLDTSSPSWMTALQAPAGRGTGPASTLNTHAGTQAANPGIVTERPTTLRLRRTSSSRHSTALSASDPTGAVAVPMGGLLSRLSAPGTWPEAPSSGMGPATAPMSLEQVLGRGDRTLETTDTTLAGGLQFSRTRLKRVDTSIVKRLETLRSLPADASTEQPLASASVLQLRTTSGTVLSAGRGGLASRGLGLAESHLAPRLAGIEPVVTNPLVALTTDNRFASVSTPLTGAWSARMAAVRSRSCEQACADVDLVELTHQGRRHAINLSVGLLKERGDADGTSVSLLGARASQSTTGLTLSAAWALTREWLAAASYSAARTTAHLGNDLPTTVAADSYGMGLLKTDTWRPGDRLSLTLLAPLAAQSGEAVHKRGTRLAQLQPDAREWTVETRYATQLPGDSTLTAAAAFKQNPDHDAEATNQMAVGVRYNRPF